MSLSEDAGNTTNTPAGGADWFARPYGRRVVAEESAVIKRITRRMMGAHGLQLGGSRFLLRHTPLHNRWWVCPHGDVLADNTALPFESESVDAVLIIHALEASPDPHAVLREAVRVLRPEGRLTVIGFNPFSLLSLASGAPYRRRWLTVWRLKDWLKLLETEPQASAYTTFLPPWKELHKSRYCRWLDPAARRWLPFTGGVYMLSVVKRRVGMRMISPKFKRRRAVPVSATITP